MQRLRKRRDFLAAREGRKAHAATLTLQARRRPDEGEAEPIHTAGSGLSEARAGFTVTKKTGGAVERNRIRRRLRAAMVRVHPGAAQDGHDYVVIGRTPALAAPFATLCNDLSHAFARVHASREGGRRERQGGPEARR